MGIEADPSPHLAQYANANKLVTNAWLGAKLGTPGLKVIESNEDSMLYDIGHIPTAIRLNWKQELSDQIHRDVIGITDFTAMMEEKGISRSDTVVIYGNHANLWAIYTLWIFELFGHPDVRLLDGGRDAWMQEEREISYSVPTLPASTYSVNQRDDAADRIFVDELRERLDDIQIIDLREPEDFAGQEQGRGAIGTGGIPTARTGHIPGAINLDTNACLLPNSRFATTEHLKRIHEHLDPNKTTVVYCVDGGRAAQHWFILKHLLGWKDVRVYDGSWIEWGNMMRVPIERGAGQE
ncbi:sulfurtransferase [Corynebacterium sp. 320]|uniref:sulfurtransferase n=1 Tax=Corynebacterium TaxID=1716 RepID=UPI00125CB9B4|nr:MULTISPECIES: sulfurtransferase [Corynebacterium]KAB1504201.1 sulfurtransferase [Corynebacterium sp. 320]KAB1552699.1 sulfurtransferase [Corynebacterium sp. 321]KAB1554083.1 sulfurtransferase [Corynebacterium sp. 319]KAB3528337.1 sulfurtransferase [Corynebacterium sp. 250]KAB3540174.1 sulfurtransferase [Corynebacterium sp. 366]